MAETETTGTEKTTDAYALCVGRYDDGKKLWWKYLFLSSKPDPDAELPRLAQLDVQSASRIWEKPLSHSPQAGWVYKVKLSGEVEDPAKAERITAYRGAMAVCPWPYDDERRELQLADDTAARLTSARKAAMDDDWREVLDPIRLAYRKSVGLRRTVILAQVVQYITGQGD